MTTYTRHDIKKLHTTYQEEIKKYRIEQQKKYLEKYNAHTDVIVKYITDMIIFLATYENMTEFIHPVVIRNTKHEEMNVDSSYIAIYDKEQIDKVFDKLKETFLDFDYKFGYNKDGNFCITINWD